MQKIRSFIAIPLPEEIQSAAGRMIQRLEPAASGIKWVAAENLHLTLKFLGDVDNRELIDVCKAMRHCCRGVEPFSLQFKGIGGFPDLQRARVVWAGVTDQSNALFDLAQSIDEKMADLRFKREFRDYQPHLTLGRLKKGSRVSDEFVRTAQAESQTVLGSMQVQQVHLCGSFLESGGPTYNVMDHVDLRVDDSDENSDSE